MIAEPRAPNDSRPGRAGRIASRASGHSGLLVTLLWTRPERIDVQPAVGSSAGALVGTVREVAFVGAHRKLAIEVNDALVINALVDARQGDEALTSVGSKVTLSWRSEDASLTNA